MRVSQWIFGAALGLAATSSQATLLTFEDIGVQGSVYPFYTQAGFVESGFRFSNNADVVDLVGSAWPYGAHSGEFAALNDYGGNIVITVDGGGIFSFQDAYLKGWANQGGASSSIAGYHGDTLVGQVNFTMAADWQNVAGNFANIDRLVVSGNTFLIDDLTFNGSSVPEPATLGLMGLGLIGMGSLRRKRK